MKKRFFVRRAFRIFFTRQIVKLSTLLYKKYKKYKKLNIQIYEKSG